MTTIYDEVKKNLEKYPSARERSKRIRFIAWLLDFTYHWKLAGINVEAMENLLKDAATYDRAWRKVLQDEEHLRGSDYEDKSMLEKEKQIELGYGESSTPQ